MNQEERKQKLIKKYASQSQFSNKEVRDQGPRGPRRPGPGGPNRSGMKKEKVSDVKASVVRLFGYIKKDKAKLVIVFLCVILTAISTLGGSYMLRPIINGLVEKNISAGEKVENLLAGLIVMAGIYVVGLISNYAQQRLMIQISQNALQSLRDDLFSKVERLPVRYYDTHPTGEMMSRFTNDVDVIGEMMNNTVVQLFSGGISIIGTFALMLYTNWILTIITIISIPVLTKAGGMVAQRSRNYYAGQQRALGAVNGYVEETISGQKVVKVFCHEQAAVEDFGILSDELQKQQLKAQFFGGIMGPVMGNLSQISYAITGMVGGILCIVRGFDIGGLTVFANYSRQFSRPINEVAMQVNTIFSALAGANRVFEMMDELPEAEDTLDAVELEHPKGYVKVENITFGYHSDKTILKQVSCYAKPGQKIAFVGSTGAGKTTITNLINRFYDIDEGKITIDNIEIQNIKRKSLRENIAMVLQDTHLFTGTVMENIRYGRMDATDDEVIQAAKTASAHSFIMRLEHGYDTMLEGDGMNLSQGQRQLLNIARAAVSKAPILILDEATSSVDTRTEKHIEHGMDRLMAQRTTFVIAHRLSTVRNANAIMVLEQGEIIEKGTHDQLIEQRGRYYQLYTGAVELD